MGLTGSTPVASVEAIHHATVAQPGRRRRTQNPNSVGSNPTCGILQAAAVAQSAGGAGPRIRNVWVRIPLAASGHWFMGSRPAQRRSIDLPLSNRISRILDTDELLSVYEDHKEIVYLGKWTELVIGCVRLVRRDDGMIEVQELDEDAGAL